MRFFKLFIFTAALLLVLSTEVWGQYVSPTSFWLSPQLTAPTAMAAYDYHRISAHYQKQGMSGSIGGRNLMLSGQFPLITRSGARLGTIGANIMRQENGASYLFATTGAMLTYNYTVNLSGRHHLVGGAQGGYFSRSIDWNKVTTSNQFVDGLLNPELSHGENFNDYKSNAFTTNVGLGYFLTDARGEQVLQLGGGLINANKARFTYLENDDNQAEPLRWTAYSHIRLISTPFYQLATNMYWQRESGYSDFVGGLQLSKGINPRKAIAEEHLGLGIYYSPDQSAIVAMQLVRENLLLGFSYSMPVGDKDVRRLQNSAEVTVGWRLKPSSNRGSSYASSHRGKLPAYKASKRFVGGHGQKDPAYKRKLSRRMAKSYKNKVFKKPTPTDSRTFSSKVSSYKYKAKSKKRVNSRSSKSAASKKYRKAMKSAQKLKNGRRSGQQKGWLWRLFSGKD